MQPPPNYSQYPRPGQPGSVGGPSFRGPGIYFDFVSEAFNLIKNNLGVYVLGTLVTLIIFYAVQIPFSLMSNMVAYGNPLGMQRSNQLDFQRFILALPISLIFGVIPGAILHFMNVGLSLCAIEQADTGSTSVNTVFAGFKNFMPVLGTVMLVQVLTTIGMIFCFFPFFIVAGLLSFAPIIAVQEGLGPVDAITKSYNLLKPYVWAMTGFYFVAGLASGIGICACGIGILFTYPILYVGIGLHYREFRGTQNQGFVAPMP